jgi:hypothetical protein
MRGISEISIVPDPGNCLRYYIIGGRRNPTDSNPLLPPGATAIPANAVNSELFYGVVNFGLQRENYNMDRIGTLELLDDNLNSGYILPLKDHIPNNQKYTSANNWSGIDFIAVTPKNAIDEHFLFYMDRFCLLYTFKIDASGISYVNNSVVDTRTGSAPNFNIPNAYIEYLSRGELEVIEISNNNYRVIGSSYNIVFNTNNDGTLFTQAADKVYRLDYNATGNPLISTFTEYQHYSPSAYTAPSRIRGIEVSPNKNFVYFTAIHNNIFERSLYCLDMATFGLVNLSLIDDATTLSYKYSMIERANNGTSDGALLLSHPNGIFQITNPNTPASAQLTSVLPITMQLSNMNYPNNPVWNDALGLYLLPDQMDFSPNITFPEDLTCECCYVYSSEDVFSPELGEDYIVQYDPIYDYENNGKQIWAPEFNPFNSMDGIVTLDANLVVPPGINLEVTGMTFKFGPNARLIIARDPNAVVPSAKVKMNGCLLTTDDVCGACHMWSGVEVQGHYNIGQSDPINTEQHNPFQGVFDISTTTIEHAYFGALAGRIVVPDQVGQGYWETFAGGIIITKNCTLQNNMHDVYFTPYSTDLSRSRIGSTLLLTDNDLRLDPTIEIRHAVLKQIRGVQFNSCTFKNDTQIDESEIYRGIGIHSFNSEFFVFGAAGNANNSKFENLRRGVLAENSNSLLPFSIAFTTFSNNFGGVETIGVNAAQVTDSKFFVYKAVPNNFLKVTFGIRLINSNRYKIEENSFEDASPNLSILADNYGVIVRDSGPFANFIQRNSFTGLFTGCMAEGVNATNYTLPSQNVRGLQFLCNSYTNNRTHDIWVKNGRIAPWQGACGVASNLQLLYPAGNKFNTASNPLWHINLGANVPPIRYFWGNGTNEEPTLITQSNVIKTECLTSISNCDQGRPGENPGLSETDLTGMRTQLQEQKHLVELLFDYSDNENTVNQVLSEFMTPQQKRDLLMTGSTIFSDEVLIKYILSNPPHTMLYQVMIHNSPLSDKVIYYMMEESDMTNGMKQQVLAIQNGLPDNETLLNYIQGIERDIIIIEQRLINAYLSDSLGNVSATNAVNMLESNEYKDEIALMNLFYANIAAQDVSKSDSLNTLLKAIFTDPEFAILSDLAVAALSSDYYTVIHDDSLLIAQLEEMAELLVYPYGYQARAILSGVLGYKFDYSSDEEFENRSAILTRYTYDGTQIEIITIFPNPTTDNFFIVFDENADVSTNREARVYDLAGNLQFTRSFNDNAYVLEINTDDMSKGMYIVVISANGTDIGTYKVAVR